MVFLMVYFGIIVQNSRNGLLAITGKHWSGERYHGTTNVNECLTLSF